MTLVNTTTRNAFYNIRRNKNRVIAVFGRLNTPGQVKVWEFADARSAQVHLEEKIEQKMNRNYVEFVPVH